MANWTQRAVGAGTKLAQNLNGIQFSGPGGAAALSGIRDLDQQIYTSTRNWRGNLDKAVRNAGTGNKRAEGVYKSEPIGLNSIPGVRPIAQASKLLAGFDVTEADEGPVMPPKVDTNPVPPRVAEKPVPDRIPAPPKGAPAAKRLLGPGNMFAPQQAAVYEQGNLFDADTGNQPVATGRGGPSDLGYGNANKKKTWKDPVPPGGFGEKDWMI